MKQIDKWKKELYGRKFSEVELDNLMYNHNFIPIECDEVQDEGVLKYLNETKQIWLAVSQDDDNMISIKDVKFVTKVLGASTKVDPFHSFEDLNKVLLYFWNKHQYHHWLCANLMVSFGRRVGDTLSLSWSDLFLLNGEYKDRLSSLKEEKTGKIVGVRIHAYAKECIDRYCKMVEIKPLEHYNEKIFSIGNASFRTAVKKAVAECGFTYPVSTHSFRKFYGNTIYKLHPHDVDRLSIIQSMFGHSDANITKMYIGAIDEKIDQYNVDYAEYLKNATAGQTDIQNQPVYSLKTEDVREILIAAYNMGKDAKEDTNDLAELNKLLGLLDQKQIIC